MKFYTQYDLYARRLFDAVFYIGFLVTIAALFITPHIFNYAVMVSYFVVMVLRMMNLRSKIKGAIIDRKTGDPLSFAVLRVFTARSSNEIKHVVADHLGRYYCLVPAEQNENYYVTIDRRNPDGSYTSVYVSGYISAQKGIIDNTFKI